MKTLYGEICRTFCTNIYFYEDNCEDPFFDTNQTTYQSYKTSFDCLDNIMADTFENISETSLKTSLETTVDTSVESLSVSMYISGDYHRDFSRNLWGCFLEGMYRNSF